MVTAADLLHLPFDDAFTRAGVAYAKTSLHFTYDRMGLNLGARLRKIVAGVAVEQAFRRWLQANGVPFDQLGATPFTEKDRYDLRLGGRRCDLKSFLLSKREDITALRREPAWLLDASALVPEDQLRGSSLDDGDIYAFGFLAGLEARQREEVTKAARAGQPLEMVASPEDGLWLSGGGPQWRPLGPLAFKTASPRPLEVEIGGQGEAREALVERLVLPPRTRVETRNAFYTLLYLSLTEQPTSAVGVSSPLLRETHVFEPTAWHNIWVYGMQVVIAGWLTKGDFRSHSQRLLAGARVKQYARTHTINHALEIRHLRPIAELAARVKEFARGAT